MQKHGVIIILVDNVQLTFCMLPVAFAMVLRWTLRGILQNDDIRLCINNVTLQYYLLPL